MNAHDQALEKSGVRHFRLYDLRHTWATRAAESGEADMSTLAALLGHSKLNMVMRYAHPQERHQAEVVTRLEKANAARQISEFEQRQKQTIEQIPATISATVSKNPPVFEGLETEGKSHRIN